MDALFKIKQEFNPDGTANERKQQHARLPNKGDLQR